ncbi:MAG: class I SAM-dependent methyltransferase [Pseudonocardiaceae bacterium]
MNEYTEMAHYYDILMAGGFYNHDTLAASLERHIGAHDHVLEIGVGTGLMAEQLRHRRPSCHLTGVDHSEAMLTIAHDRVGEWCTLVQADVTTMALGQSFDVIFSCGGVWFLIDAGTERQLCSHIPDEAEDDTAFGKALGHLKPEGLLLLSIQEVNQDYETTLPGGVLYRQSISWRGTLFQKEYAFEGPQGNAVQHNTFRIRHQPDMEAFFRRHGLVALPEATDGSFHAFRNDPAAVPRTTVL